MKPRHLWISVIAVMFFGSLLSQDALARIAWQRFGRPDVAVLLVRRDAQFALLLGNYYFGQTLGRSAYDLTRAEQAYRKALAAQPGILWGHYQLARIYFLQNTYNRAIEEINAELAANPENLRSLYVRGLIYGYRGEPSDLKRAEDDFRQFIAWAPKEWAGYNDLAWILTRAGRYAEAESVAGAGIREALGGAKNPWLWNSTGVAELNMHQYGAAEAAFRAASSLVEHLTTVDWRAAYPGNNPADAEGGRTAFRQAIAENLARATAARSR